MPLHRDIESGDRHTDTQAETDREGMEAERRTEKGWRQRDGQRRDGGRDKHMGEMERVAQRVSCKMLLFSRVCLSTPEYARARTHTHTQRERERERETHTLTPTPTHSLSFLPPHPLREQTPTVKAGIERSSTDHVSSR